MIKEKTLEMRGMRRQEIVDYFIGIGGKQTDNLKIEGDNWLVELSEEKSVRLGSLAIPATTVVFRCENDLLELMLQEFRLKFLAAGG